MGTGGLGGSIGGLLARSGEAVTFVARGARLDAIRRRGLTVKSELAGTFTIPEQVTEDPSAISVVDLVPFTVKSNDLEVAAEQIRPLLGPDTVVLPFQSGVDAAE